MDAALTSGADGARLVAFPGVPYLAHARSPHRRLTPPVAVNAYGGIPPRRGQILQLHGRGTNDFHPGAYKLDNIARSTHKNTT